MKLIKKFNIVLAITICFQSCGSKLPIYEVKENATNYNPLNEINDFYNEDAKLGYTVLKDNDYLYVHLSTKEVSTQLKILHNGVKFFIDKKGQQNQDMYIHYPLEADGKEKINFLAIVKDKVSFINDKITKLNENIAIVNEEGITQIKRNFNAQNISTEIKLVDEELYYQIKLPIEYFSPINDKLTSLGIEIKGLSIRPLQSSQNSIVSGRGSGSKGSGGGRGGGGRGRGGNTGSSNVSKSTPDPSKQIQGLTSNAQIWIKLDLKD